MIADVVFPAPSAAYFLNLFFPLSAIAALATELGVYVYFQRGRVSFPKLFGVVLGVNIYSWLVGVLVSTLIPGLIPQLSGVGLPGGAFAIIGLLWACLLSTALEYHILWSFRKELVLRRLGVCVATANFFGYIALGLVVWACIGLRHR